MLTKNSGWRLDEHDLVRLREMLGRPDRPTAIFAAGNCFSLDVYAAATILGLRCLTICRSSAWTIRPARRTSRLP